MRWLKWFAPIQGNFVHKYLLAILMSVYGNCHAGSFVIASSKAPAPVAIALEVDAEYVAVPMTIYTSEKEALQSFDILKATTARIIESASKTATIKVRQGSVSLVVDQAEGGNFVASKSYGGSSSTARMYLTAALTNGRDIFQVTREINAFAKTIVASDRSRITFGEAAMGIDAPERFKSQILGLIAKDSELARKTLGNQKQFEVSGLESPVMVLQLDDKRLVLYIPYKLKVGQ